MTKQKIEKITSAQGLPNYEWLTNHRPGGCWDGAETAEEKIEMLMDKLNEIIDYLNKGGGRK
jgi:hypothetical protein